MKKNQITLIWEKNCKSATENLDVRIKPYAFLERVFSHFTFASQTSLYAEFMFNLN